jgi:hypothetical protein
MAIEIPDAHSFQTRQDCYEKLRCYCVFHQHFWEFALRTIVLVTAILVPAVASATAYLPFAPIAPQPDYVVTMSERLFAMDVKRSVTHHGDWTRVDRIGEHYRSTNYYSVNGAVAVHDQRSALVTSFARGIDLSYRDYRPRNTGERQARLGETCTVWEVSRTITDAPGGSNYFHLSCITDDGIELWQRSIYGSNVTSTEATRVERRPVTADEVKPPRSLLMLDWWDRDAPSTIPGAETMMELSAKSVGAGKSIRITRQRGPWQSIEETVSGVRRRLEIVHDSDRRHFEYVWDESSAPKRLSIDRPPSTPGDTASASFAMWNETDRSETILGETCRWFYLVTTGDFSRSRCLTNDGVVLKDHQQWRAEMKQEMVVREWTAIRLTRRPISLDEIKPPADLLEPQRWGIE